VPDQILQSKRRPLPAAPCLTRRVLACLAVLRCIDAVQSDALAVDFQRVAVDDGCDASDVGIWAGAEPDKPATKSSGASIRAQVVVPDL
jgi:hypothetical protein